MCSDLTLKYSTLTPSRRKSIHNYKGCLSTSSEIMGRYGLNTDSIKRPLSNDLDVDEPDNVMSKHLSAGSLNTNCHVRNKSYNNSISQEELDDSDEDVVLSKSLPASLPSHLNYSDWPSSTVFSTSSDSMTHEQIVRRNNTPSYSPEGRRQNERLPDIKHENNIQNNLVYILILVIGVTAALYFKYINGDDKSIIYDNLKFSADLENLKDKYKINMNSIIQLETGISTISERHDTSSFMFVYNSNINNFNQNLLNDLVDDIATTAARLLRNDSTDVKHVLLDISSLRMSTHGELMNEYRDTVAKNGVMLVRNLHELPSSLAMAFHYYCDENNPLIKKSAIFFTFDLGKCYNSSSINKSLHARIENCLMDKWRGIPKDNMRPLLTRVVNVLVDVTDLLQYDP